MAGSNVVIVGGNGKVSQRLTRLLTSGNSAHRVTSVIRSDAQAETVKGLGDGVTPVVLSLEKSPVEDFTRLFEGKDIIYFSAGAGGKAADGEEAAARTKAVDYEGAMKVFDALDAVSGKKPRLILVSAIDIRNPDKIPDHYDDNDRAISTRVRTAIATYMHWKYEADKNLVQRTSFEWTILRPGGLNDEPGAGKVDLGRTHITKTVSRDDVAQVLYHLASHADAAGLAIDLVGGDKDIEPQLDAFIKRGETDFLG